MAFAENFASTFHSPLVHRETRFASDESEPIRRCRKQVDELTSTVGGVNGTPKTSEKSDWRLLREDVRSLRTDNMSQRFVLRLLFCKIFRWLPTAPVRNDRVKSILTNQSTNSQVVYKRFFLPS
jgi:hypothetical protein